MVRTFNKEAVNLHSQKYMYSCIPSAVEMVLKLLNKVDMDYYCLQDEWREKSDGTFMDFHDRNIFGLKFTEIFHKHPLRGNKEFPYEELYKIIDDNLELQRYVIISLSVPGGAHMYVIFGKENSEYLTFTKEKINEPLSTKIEKNTKYRISKMKGTDILTYEEQN